MTSSVPRKQILYHRADIEKQRSPDYCLGDFSPDQGSLLHTSQINRRRSHFRHAIYIKFYIRILLLARDFIFILIKISRIRKHHRYN